MGAQRPRTPQGPSPLPEREFVVARLQEPLEDLENAITLEEPNGQVTRRREDMDLVKRPAGETQGFHVPQHPPPEAQAGRQIREVEVMLRKLPLHVREEENRYTVDPEAGRRVRRSHPQEAGPEGRPGEQPGTPGEGQEREVRRSHL